MKVFISDLHLGDGTRTEDFHRDNQFLKFLDFVEKNAAELIIVGDLLELWQSDLDKILFTHNEVINRILVLSKKIKITYVVGNHDYVPFARLVNPDIGIVLTYEDKKHKLIAEHGFAYDIFNNYKNPLQSIKWPLGEYFAVVIGGLERIIHRDIDNWAKDRLEKIDDFLHHAAFIRNKVTPSSEDYLKKGGHFGEFQKAVENHIDNGKRIVVFGHTHRAQLEETKKGIYANCGTWVDGSNPTYIALSDEKIELREALTHKVIKAIELR